MAVPKKKRYKQIVRSRRSLEKLNLLRKQKVNSTFYSNFIYKFQTDIANYGNNTCAYCDKSTSKRICLNCYTTHFLGAYVKYIGKRNK